MFCDICHSHMEPFQKDLQICPQDGLITSHLKARVELYDAGYSQKHLEYAHNDIDVKLQEIRRNFVIQNVPEYDQGEILDFGCGNGSFLKSLDGHFGVRHGFDINPYEGFTRIDYLLRRYNVVTMWDVLEHLESPASFLKGLKVKHIFITVPNVDDAQDIVTWRHYRPNEHIHYFTLNSLIELLLECGFQPITHNFNESEVRKGGGEKGLISICGVKVS